jgi:hypothetical protein
MRRAAGKKTWGTGQLLLRERRKTELKDVCVV